MFQKQKISDIVSHAFAAKIDGFGSLQAIRKSSVADTSISAIFAIRRRLIILTYLDQTNPNFF